MNFFDSGTPIISSQVPPDADLDYEKADFFVFCEQRVVSIDDQIRAWKYEELIANLSADIDATDILFVGQVESKQIFAITVDSSLLQPEFDLFNLRDLLYLDRSLFQMIGRALQIIRWDMTHRFCGQCGKPTQRNGTEIMRQCEPCNLRLYPRISPCVIMLVHRGDKILLAQRPGTRTTWYTIQAGFIEAGESAEEAVHREVLEETGLKLSSLSYFGSEPWPFPGQLMLGYIAENLEGEVIPDPEELANADWFDYRNLPEIPSEHSISGKLIRHFVAQRESSNKSINR